MRFLVSVVVLVGLVGPIHAQGYEVETIRGVAYQEGDGADAVRHLLDIHRPKGVKNYPVLFFVHGGAWKHGNKDHLGMYSLLGRTLARQGIGLVSPNYRLTPQVQHPEHIRDVAKAFAWTHANIAKHGGDPRMIFVGGHSAGGHLSALLATDETYLKAEGLSLANIRGAIPISGVYTIAEHRVFETAFGKDAEIRRLASPITHAGVNRPPFLILYGDQDIPYCDRPFAQAFFKALEEKKCSAQVCEVSTRNHVTILLNAASKETDPAMQRILSFILSQVITDRLMGDAVGAVDEMGDVVARFAANAAK